MGPKLDVCRVELLVYVCNLAEAKGFKIAVGCLERVWERAADRGDTLALHEGFRDARAQPISNPGFLMGIQKDHRFHSIGGCITKAELGSMNWEMAAVTRLMYFLLAYARVLS